MCGGGGGQAPRSWGGAGCRAAGRRGPPGGQWPSHGPPWPRSLVALCDLFSVVLPLVLLLRTACTFALRASLLVLGKDGSIVSLVVIRVRVTESLTGLLRSLAQVPAVREVKVAQLEVETGR